LIFRVPFGRGFETCEVDDSKITGSLEPSWPSAALSQERYVSEAMARPIGSERLKHLASGMKNVLILTSDNTRPVPSRLTLPPVLEEIKQAAPSASVRILVGTGLHEWSPTDSELKEKLGSVIDRVDEVRIHSAKDKDSLIQLGQLPSGNELWVNGLTAGTDLIVADGFIEGHFFAGFTGGPKSVLPGIAGSETIMHNHSPRNIDNPNARCGVIRGNPIHEEMLEAARRVGLKFILNVVLDKSKNVISAFAGDPTLAHGQGTVFSLKCCRVTPAFGDIVVTSNGGYPLDRNLYQLVKGISNGALTAKDGGVIVACGECLDGVGHEGFRKMLASASDPSEFLRRLRRGEIWEEAQWEAQVLAKVLEKFKVIIVSRGVDRRTVESMHMAHAKSLREGLEEAFKLKPRGRITLLPDGPSAIPL
jgi:nickel-dependent lactate racemase